MPSRDKITSSSLQSEPAVAAAPDSSTRDLLSWILDQHRLQETLCGLLEEIADMLPGPVDRLKAEFSLKTLRDNMSHYVAVQERLLFPLLRRRAEKEDNIDALIRRITSANHSDEGLAYDIADQLEDAIARGRPENPDMLAFMLRGFFEGRRRQISWEGAIMIPLARQRLTPGDLRPLSNAEIDELVTAER